MRQELVVALYFRSHAPLIVFFLGSYYQNGRILARKQQRQMHDVQLNDMCERLPRTYFVGQRAQHRSVSCKAYPQLRKPKIRQLTKYIKAFVIGHAPFSLGAAVEGEHQVLQVGLADQWPCSLWKGRLTFSALGDSYYSLLL